MVEESIKNIGIYRMNILLLSNKVPFPPKDGGAIATLNLSKGFASLGHMVTILAINTPKHHMDINQIPVNIKNMVKIIGIDVDTGVKTFQALSNLFFSKLPYHAQRFFSKDYESALKQLLKKNKFDVIQLEGLYMGMYIPAIREYSDALLSMRAHNIEYEIWERIALQQKTVWKKIYLKILSKRLKRLEIKQIKQYDVLVPISQRDATIFKKLEYHKPIHVIPASIDLKDFRCTIRGKITPSLFFIGALDWTPNLEGIIWFLKMVWGKICNKYPNLEFYIAGRNAPKWLIHKFNSENIVFLGEIDDALEFMKSKAIMIVPLFSGSGIRIKIIEGMALGKIIISTSIGTEGINSTHNKNILIADTPENFIKEIEKILHDQNIFSKIGKNAIEFVKENFDNLAISSSLIDFYKSQIK